MTWDVSDDPVDFDEAIAWFRARVKMTREERDRLDAKARRQAFFVSGIAQLDLVNDVWKALDRALKDGTSLEDFKAAIGPKLEAAWKGTVDDPARRLETIFRVNVQAAYSAGRYEQATHPDIIGDRPVWMYDAILDGRETAVCKACDGTKLPANDTWWNTHIPPLHFNCRSTLATLTEEEAGALTTRRPSQAPQEGFGLSPKEGGWEPDISKYPNQLREVFEQKSSSAPPAPPPAELTDGTHASIDVKRGVPKQQADELRKSISEPELLKWLETNPLRSLVVRQQSTVGSKKVNGWYLNGVIELTANRQPGTFGQTFAPGTVWSLSSAVATAEDAAKATLRHELGHHIHLLGGRGTTVDQIVQSAYKQAKLSGTYITRYAATRADEYFAESFAAYYLRRGALKAHDPNAYKMVEDVLTVRGILP